MDDNTAEVLRVLIAALFGVILFGGLFWSMAKTLTSGSFNASVELPEQPMWKCTHTWGDDDEEERKSYEAIIAMQDAEYDELHEDNQRVRDRLAAALWENRGLKREASYLYQEINRGWRDAVQSDDQVAWLADEIAHQTRESEGA